MKTFLYVTNFQRTYCVPGTVPGSAGTHPEEARQGVPELSPASRDTLDGYKEPFGGRAHPARHLLSLLVLRGADVTHPTVAVSITEANTRGSCHERW